MSMLNHEVYEEVQPKHSPPCSTMCIDEVHLMNRMNNWFNLICLMMGSKQNR